MRLQPASSYDLEDPPPSSSACYYCDDMAKSKLYHHHDNNYAAAPPHQNYSANTKGASASSWNDNDSALTSCLGVMLCFLLLLLLILPISYAAVPYFDRNTNDRHMPAMRNSSPCYGCWD